MEAAPPEAEPRPARSPLSARPLRPSPAVVASLLLFAAVACGAAGVAILAGPGWMLVFLGSAFFGLFVLIARGLFIHE